MHRKPIHLCAGLALIGALLLQGCAVPPSTQDAGGDAALVPPPAIRLEGVPAVPSRLLGALERYSRIAGHQFADWHPAQREMLLTHRAPTARTTQLYRLRSPMGVPEPLTDSADPVRTASWEPREGRYIVFPRSRGGDEADQLFRLDPATRAATPFTPADQRHEFQGWLRSRSLAVVTSLPLNRTAQGGTRAEIHTTLWTVDPENPASRRVIAELPGGGWFGAVVSPNEQQLAITRFIAATHSEAWLIDLASGERRRVLPAPGETLRAAHRVADWSADGRRLLVLSDRAGEFRELMSLELASGTLERLTRHIAWDVSDVDVPRSGQRIAVTANVDGRDTLHLFDAGSGSELPTPMVPAGGVTRLRSHPASGELALVIDSPQGPLRIHTLDAQGRTTAWTVPAATEQVDLSALPEQRIVRWPSFDGRTISGVLSLPPARFAGPRPVLMVMHGGPESQAKQGWIGRLNYLTLERGIAVLEPNVRGSSGYGKTFLDLDNGRLREDSVRDMAAALDWIATQPGLDAKRVVVYGGSYGGYMALAASVRLADRIAGAVSAVGISNFVSFLENTESYRRDLRRVEYGDERDPAMREFLTSISPLTHAERITKPLFVVQGRNDPRVPYTESEQIVRSLQRRGTPVWYLLADNEGHGFARRENADFYFATAVRFLEQTLRP